MSHTHRKQWIGIVCLLVTASGWALNWPLMKILLRDWPPLFARGLAGVIACDGDVSDLGHGLLRIERLHPPG